MEPIILRDYQQECVEKINILPPGSYMIQLPTGTGKTVIFSHIERHGRMLILSHRDELVHQPIKYFDCPCGIEQGNERSHGEEVISASVMSLHRRLQRFKPDDFDIIITDECHHSIAKTYRKIYDYFKPRLHLGFTATPSRGDHVRLDDIYSEIIFKRDILWGIKHQYLCDIDCMRVNIGYDISKVRIRQGDFEPGQLSAELNHKVINEGIAKVYEQYANGQTLIFAVSVEHAKGIAKEIPGAKVITAETKNRDKILEDFKKKKVKCLINCMIFTEGTDLPLIETIIVARPTKNSTLYTQMVGRGLRLYPGKEKLRLIDCVGATEINNLCTAPSLLGIDVTQVPERKRKLIQGDLTKMQAQVSALVDMTPESWILSYKQMNLFLSDNHLDTYGVRYTLGADGSMRCSLLNNIQIIVSAPDQLGHSKCTYIRTRPRDLIFKKESRDMPTQEIFKNVRKLLEEKHASERRLWDITEVQKWCHSSASMKQKDYIRTLLFQNKQKIDTDIDLDKLTKEEASVIIDRLKSQTCC